MSLNPFEYAQTRVRETTPALAWKRAKVSPMEWQTELRLHLLGLLGELDGWQQVPLDARTTETIRLDGYRREKVTFATRPGLSATGYLLIPDHCPPCQPAVLCLPGHGRGAASIVGIAEGGMQRRLGENGEYQADFALQCVAQRWPVFALEQISFGERRGNPQGEGAGASSCQQDSMAALMVGESMTGWRVWDAMRALDYLATRPEVDPERLMTMGISGGGLTSLFTAALDTRVWGAIVSGYLNTFADSILSISHCVDNYVPGLLKVAEMPDIAGCIAPRRLFVENGSDDPIFPVAAFKKAAEKLTEIYAAFGVPERFSSETFAGGHLFYGVGAFAFLREQLVAEQ